MRRSFLAVVVAFVVCAPAHAATTNKPAVNGRAVAGYDPVAKTFFFEKRADARLAPASLAKMATALVAAKHLRPADEVAITAVVKTGHADTIVWPQGATFTADHVMHGMLMQSSNGAAYVVAQKVGGTVSRFVAMMNAEAVRLGALDTHFTTPDGWDAAGQYSTAHDLALIGAAALREPWLAQIVRTKEYEVPWPSGAPVTFHTLNSFLVKYEGALGIKTGFTAKSGECLAAAAARNGTTLVVVVLDSTSRVNDAMRVMNYGFATRKVEAAPVPSASPTQLTAEETAPCPGAQTHAGARRDRNAGRRRGATHAAAQPQTRRVLTRYRRARSTIVRNSAAGMALSPSRSSPSSPLQPGSISFSSFARTFRSGRGASERDR